MANKQKIVVVTGVSRGLGRALTNGLVKAGHTVLGTARTQSAIKELVTRYPSPHRFDVVDQTKPDQIADWVQSVIGSHGAPDLLVNNAAMINPNAPLWQVPDNQFSELIDTNIKGVFHVCKQFLPAMIERGTGVTVNLSSGWGRSVAAEVAPYCATKWAIEGLTLSLAEELPSGLAAATLNPGVINTDMLQSCFGPGASSYRSPEEWAETAVPFLTKLDASCNGKALTAP